MNDIVQVSMEAYAQSSIDFILAESYKVCCSIQNSNISCLSEPEWPHSCSQLLSSAVRAVMWCTCIGGYVLNILLSIWYYFHNENCKKSKKSLNYQRIVKLISFSDCLHLLNLFIILLADIMYGESYIEMEFKWRQSIFCFTAGLSTITSILMSCSALNLMAASRFCITKYPFDSRFLETKFTRKVISAIFCFCSAISIIIVICYKYLDSALLPTGICLLLGNIEKSILQKLITILVFLMQLSTAVSIAILYFLIYLSMKKHNITIGEVSKGQEKQKGLIKNLLASLSDIVSLFTSCVVLLITLLWQSYPYQILLWYTALILPLNSILDPLVFSKKPK